MRLVDDYPGLGARNPVYEVVWIAGKNQFARRALFQYPAHQWETGEQFSLADYVIHYMFSGNRIIE